MKVVISAAGTGGHINPALAIANKIKKEESGSEIVFIGTNRGLENDLVPRSRISFKNNRSLWTSKRNFNYKLKKCNKNFSKYEICKRVFPRI